MLDPDRSLFEGRHFSTCYTPSLGRNTKVRWKVEVEGGRYPPLPLRANHETPVARASRVAYIEGHEVLIENVSYAMISPVTAFLSGVMTSMEWSECITCPPPCLPACLPACPSGSGPDTAAVLLEIKRNERKKEKNQPCFFLECISVEIIF